MSEPGLRPPPPTLQANAHQALQQFLIKVIARCQQSWHIVHHLGFLPQVPLTSKFPYYQQAVAHPQAAAKLSLKQTHALQLHASLRSAPARPDLSGIRPRPKRARDAFGPGMVFVVNTVLAWLMFSIDVRNSML